MRRSARGSDGTCGRLRLAIAVGGTSVCGTFARTEGAGVHLPAAFTRHDGSVVAQQQGTSEITWFQPLLNRLDLTGRILTADAPHTTSTHARYLTSAGADHVLVVKRNHHRLHAIARHGLAERHASHQHRHRARPP